MVTIGIGTGIYTQNSAIPNTFANDKSFTFISDNSGLQLWVSTGTHNVDKLILGKKWRITETGHNYTGYTVSVTDNSSVSFTGKLPAETSGVYLIIDTDSDFTSGATEYPMTLSGTEWIVTNIDLNDAQFFTFATEVPPAPG